ncbi:MAG: TadE/TadG family type IV pilus assembly protein [Chloroflexota bacterium]|nr:TadE/TadG family type IV pilus assembly protein [Chloroflexota bacterium]
MYVLPANQSPGDLQRKRRFRGQTLVEFALVLPVMLLVLFVIIEMARLLHAWLAVENGARFGIRYAVTGEYDQAFCVDGPDAGTDACAGSGRLAEEDAARLPSIEDATRAGAVAIMRNETVPVASPGYFKITLCSSKRSGAGPLFSYHDSVTPVHQPAWCEQLPSPGISVSDAGGPGDRVSVTVDFEHPLIVPMLSSALPHIHLTSKREGIVEQFRVARVVGLPATISVPTFTPTNTATATATATSTQTPTPSTTPCKVPPVVQIILPVNGATYNFKVPGQAVAYDPDNADPAACAGVGVDGEGIVQVDFAIDFWDASLPTPAWTRVFTSTETAQAYCAFSGNAPCSEHPTFPTNWPGGIPMGSGLHRMQAIATDDEGDVSPVDEVQFLLNVPFTPTPTVTPTIDCNAITVNQYYTSGEGLYMLVTNNNPQTINLTNSHTNWNEMSVAHNVDQLQYGWMQYYPGDDYNSPTIRGPAAPSSFPHPPGVSKYWAADFNNTPGGELTGDFDTTLTFDSVCLVSSSITIPTPTTTPTTTNTPTPTQTFTPTTTPLPTSTPTITPTPSCAGVSFGSTTFLNGARINLGINNTTYPGLQITGVTVLWGPLQTASNLYGWNEYVNWANWNGSYVYLGDDFTSTTSFGFTSAANPSNNLTVDWGGLFAGSFMNAPLNLGPANFGFSIQFSDPACNISRGASPVTFPTPTHTPPPTNTPTATNTPTNTPTPTITPSPTVTNTPLPTTPTHTATPVTPSPTPTDPGFG